MPEYLSPGVYVEEVPSAVKPIAGVSTSTAGFVGVIAGPTLDIPGRNPLHDPTGKSADPQSKSTFRTWKFPFPDAEYQAAKKAFDDLAEPGVKPARPRDAGKLKEFRAAQIAFAEA